MSKNNSTKILILNHSLKLFNAKGIEFVGVRDIANDLNMRVGNVTYYFPTKDDIVAAIAAELADMNNKTVITIEGLSMQGFLNMYKKIFENHFQFRCLFISFVHQMEQNKKLERAYMQTQQKRFIALKTNIEELIENKYLKSNLDKKLIENMVSTLSFFARFWLPESRIRFRGVKKQKIFSHYLSLIAHQLAPYSTPKGLKEIEFFLLQI